jgi:Tol biopolymer transport system component
MKSKKYGRFSLAGWLTILFIGLVIESCFLAVLAGVYLNQRNEPERVGQGWQPQPVLATLIGQIGETEAPISEITATIPESIANETPTSAAPLSTSVLLLDTPTAWQYPPGGKIIFVCFDGKFDQICLMNPDGTERKQLTDSTSTNFYPSLSPDGQYVVFSSNRTGVFEIFLMQLASGELTQLTDGIGNLYAPEISPNGNRVIFTQESGRQQNIWLMRLDGNNPRALTDSGSDIDPTWSPNGEQIAFTSARNGAKQLFIMNANGENERPILLDEATKIGGRISWSPDNNWLAYYAGEAGNRNIFLTSVNGKQVYQLTQQGDNLGPSFSKDGEWLAFTSFRDGNNEIYIMRVDGSDQARLTRSPLSDWQPRWGN